MAPSWQKRSAIGRRRGGRRPRLLERRVLRSTCRQQVPDPLLHVHEQRACRHSRSRVEHAHAVVIRARPGEQRLGRPEDLHQLDGVQPEQAEGLRRRPRDHDALAIGVRLEVRGASDDDRHRPQGDPTKSAPLGTPRLLLPAISKHTALCGIRQGLARGHRVGRPKQLTGADDRSESAPEPPDPALPTLRAQPLSVSGAAASSRVDHRSDGDRFITVGLFVCIVSVDGRPAYRMRRCHDASRVLVRC